MVDSRTEKQTLVEEGTEFTGTLKAKCKVVVRGAIDGHLEAPAVDVTETGKVTGNLKAGTVRSAGVLAGTIEADDITLSGRVESKTVIRAKSLEVKLSAESGRLEVTFGDCIVEIGDAPAETSRAGLAARGNGKVASSNISRPSGSGSRPLASVPRTTMVTAAATDDDEDVGPSAEPDLDAAH
jgi:cytoskeletal protein CcmA (bactofilin family)